jgi:predicted acetyltransferase
MENNIKLRKLDFKEETKIIDVINQDDDLINTFSGDRGIRSRLANSCYSALIEKDGKSIGFVMIVNNPRTDINEIDMGVLKEHRGKGYGTEALGILKDIIVANGLEVEVQTKRKNIAAITSIVYNGFKLIRDDKDYYYYSIPEEEYIKKR